MFILTLYMFTVVPDKMFYNAILLYLFLDLLRQYCIDNILISKTLSIIYSCTEYKASNYLPTSQNSKTKYIIHKINQITTETILLKKIND